MADCLRANLDHPIPQAGERPVSYGVRQHQGAQEVRQIVGQCMKLKLNFIGFEALAGKPCPFEHVFAFLDVLLSGTAPVVELEHPFIGNGQCRDQIAHSRKQLSGVPFLLGHNLARFAPALGLIDKVGIMAFHGG